MAQFLDLTGLQKYDELIKNYITVNGGKIDVIKIKTPANTTGAAATITDKTVTIDLSGFLTGVKVGSTSLTPSSGVVTISKDNLTGVIGNVSSSADGLMSKTDKTNLDTLVTLLGDKEGSDTDTVVSKINEVLKVFETYPEGSDIATLLSGKADASAVYNKTELDNLLANKADTSALDDYVPTSRTVNGKALTANIWIETGAAWGAGKSYAVGDLVQHTSGSGNAALTGLYYCRTAHTSTNAITPTNTTNWTLLAVSNDATVGAKGLMTKTMVTKLNGIAESATADSAIATSSIEALFAA